MFQIDRVRLQEVNIKVNNCISGIDNLNDVGCFGLTELGYGNNAVEMETTAVYDKVKILQKLKQ